VTTGVERLIGTEGVVVADLNPSGTARVGAELWTAESISGTVKQGELVRVVAAEGLRLRVVPVGSTEEKDLTESAGGRS